MLRKLFSVSICFNQFYKFTYIIQVLNAWNIVILATFFYGLTSPKYMSVTRMIAKDIFMQ